MQLDAIDLRILRELQQDGSLTNVELARRVHLSPSPCLARVKALEAAGVIARYVALADAKLLGLGLNVFINISLKSQSKESLGEFERRIDAAENGLERNAGVLPALNESPVDGREQEESGTPGLAKVLFNLSEIVEVIPGFG